MAKYDKKTRKAPVGFFCNVCGTRNAVVLASLRRETGPCTKCGAIVRLRAIAYLVSNALFGKALPIPQWPDRPDLRGIGVSDWPAFEKIYNPKISYTNTQFDREIFDRQKFLDITKPPPELLGTCDVVSCSEVLEHVVPPVSLAFDGLFSILKPGGTLIFTVPFQFGETIEHFPDLYDWKLVEHNGGRKLVNVTRDNKRQEFTELCFHGGGSSVLEMRLFGLDGLTSELEKAGFTEISVMSENHMEFGIYWPEPWSRPIVAKRPRDTATTPLL